MSKFCLFFLVLVLVAMAAAMPEAYIRIRRSPDPTHGRKYNKYGGYGGQGGGYQVYPIIVKQPYYDHGNYGGGGYGGPSYGGYAGSQASASSHTLSGGFGGLGGSFSSSSANAESQGWGYGR